MKLSWLDFKLGFRMLARYPMLTVVGSLAMAVAIAVGAGTFEVITRATNPSLPLPNGDRIVGLNYWDKAEPGVSAPSAYDALAWKDRLRKIEDLGAFRLVQRNLIVEGRLGDPVAAAEMTAAAFRVAGVPALIGRVLLPADELPGAPAVVVLGHRLWKTRFDGDPGVIGRAVRLGSIPVTVVGVMPEGFAFPVRQNLWTILRPSDLAQEPGRGRLLRVFGRLPAGVELAEAQAELTALAPRVAERFSKEYAHLQPQVLPYAESFIEIPQDFLVRAGIQSVNIFGALFLVVVCGDVALLMFARAAAREREIVVRQALGAPRSRIVAQLFVEALVLAAIAAVFGLAATDFALKWTLAALSSEADGWPFWIEGGLSATTVLYSIALTGLAAIVAGVGPGLKITRRNVEAALRQSSAGVGGIRMDGIWTAVIVLQIATTVLFTAVAYVVHRQAAGIASASTTFPANEYLAVRLDLDMDGDGESFVRRYGATARDLQQQAAAEPGVAGATLAEQLPLMPAWGRVFELDEPVAAETGTGRELFASTAAVDVDFFDVFETPVLAGRGFVPQDRDGGAHVVVVNQLFVDRLLGGRNAVGRRIRYRAENANAAGASAVQQPWWEIVGVVRDLVPDPALPLNLDNPGKIVVYHPLSATATTAHALYLATRVTAGDAMSVLPALRRLAADVNPELRLTDIQTLDEGTSTDVRAWRGFANLILLLSGLALVLSLAGLYAITSFSVSRRTREIAIRAVLGARTPNVVWTVFRGPFVQGAMGVVAGCLMMGGTIALFQRNADVGAATIVKYAAILSGYGTLMMSICGLACIGPLVRILRVEPTDVLRDDG